MKTWIIQAIKQQQQKNPLFFKNEDKLQDCSSLTKTEVWDDIQAVHWTRARSAHTDTSSEHFAGVHYEEISYSWT